MKTTRISNGKGSFGQAMIKRFYRKRFGSVNPKSPDPAKVVTPPHKKPKVSGSFPSSSVVSTAVATVAPSIDGASSSKSLKDSVGPAEQTTIFQSLGTTEVVNASLTESVRVSAMRDVTAPPVNPSSMPTSGYKSTSSTTGVFDWGTDPQACREFLFRSSIPMDEAKFTQDKSTKRLGDDIALALSNLVCCFPEIIHRAEFFEGELRRMTGERQEMEKELKHLRKQVLDLQASRETELNKRDELEDRILSLEGKHLKSQEENLRVMKIKDDLVVSRSAELKRSRAECDRLKEEVESSRVYFENKTAECELLLQEKAQLGGINSRLKTEKRWLIEEGIPRSFEIIQMSDKYLDMLVNLITAHDLVGCQDGLREGFLLAQDGRVLEGHHLLNYDGSSIFTAVYDNLSDSDFPIMSDIVATAGDEDLSRLQELLKTPAHPGDEKPRVGSSGRREPGSKKKSASKFAKLICKKMEEDKDSTTKDAFKKNLPYINSYQGRKLSQILAMKRSKMLSSSAQSPNTSTTSFLKPNTPQDPPSRNLRPRRARANNLVDKPLTHKFMAKLDPCMKDVKVYYPSRDDPDAVEVTYDDMACLAPEACISSAIMNFYIRLLQKPSSSSEGAICNYHIFNTYFYNKLEKLSYKEDSFLKFRKWWKGVSLFDKAYILLPINEYAHWSLVIICLPNKDDELGPILFHLDSLGLHDSMPLFNNIERFLKEEWSYLRKSESPLNLALPSEIWEHLDRRLDHSSVNVPQQKNDYDCGLFVLFYMERFIKEAPERFTEKDLSMFSRQWFRPREASNLRTKIIDLLVEQFKKVKEC